MFQMQSDALCSALFVYHQKERSVLVLEMFYLHVVNSGPVEMNRQTYIANPVSDTFQNYGISFIAQGSKNGF